MRSPSALVLAALLLAGSEARLQAQPPPAPPPPAGVESLGQLSLEQLLNVEVTSTTRSSMDIRRAPGVVRVFTRADIARFGFITLRDVLQQVPGAQVIEYRAGHQTIWMRGVQSRYNNKVLLLVDGVPVRDSYYGHFDIDESLPLDHVERIEIINGPGSVLYGANAFAGVISITTRPVGPAGERASIAGGIEAGSFDTSRGAVEFAGRGLYGHASYLTTGGFSPALNGDGRPWPHAQEGHALSSYVKYASGAWAFIGGYGNSTHADRYRKRGQDRFWRRAPVTGAVSFRKDFDRDRRLTLLGHYVRTSLAKDEFALSAPGVRTSHVRERLDTSLLGVDGDYASRWGRLGLTIGGAFALDRDEGIDVRSVVPAEAPQSKLHVPGVSRRSAALFVDADWLLGRGTALFAGARGSALSPFNDELSFRAGLTHNGARAHAKLLFGTAFREPSYREYLDVVAFNDALQPEDLHTLEAQVGMRVGRGDVNVTAYVNQYDHFIKDLMVASIRTPSGARVIDDEYAVNADSRRIVGLEFQATFHPRDTLTVGAGSGVLLSGRERIGALGPGLFTLDEPVDLGEASLRNLSDLTINGLVSYRPVPRVNLSARVLAFSDRPTGPGYQAGVPADLRNPDNADAAVTLDASGSLAVTRTLDLTANVSNVLDATIFSPPFLPDSAYDNEWMGRRVRVGLRYRFR